MNQQDTGLYKSFAVVLGALVLFTLLIIVVANVNSPSTDYSNDSLIANAVKKQIEPVGRSNVRATEEAETVVTASTETTAKLAAEVPDTQVEPETQAVIQSAATVVADAAASIDRETGAGVDTAVADATEDTSTTLDADVVSASIDTSIEIPLKVRAVVATNCAGCHAKGVRGAQRNDDTEAWQGLTEKGIDALTASVISGLGEMPARAGSTLDDTEIQLAVQHMINRNLGGGQSVVAKTKPVPATQVASIPQQVTTEPVAISEPVAAAEPVATAELVAANNEAAITESAVAEPDATKSAAAETVATESVVAEPVATVQVESAAANTVATATAARVATVLPASVKSTVDGLCAACHISGVGNAPKYGDKEAWAARMAKGIDAVVASAIAGKGAMPARGGSQLTDEEIKLAIQYMVSK